jgi:hypothetical protein
MDAAIVATHLLDLEIVPLKEPRMQRTDCKEIIIPTKSISRKRGASANIRKAAAMANRIGGSAVPSYYGHSNEDTNTAALQVKNETTDC